MASAQELQQAFVPAIFEDDSKYSAILGDADYDVDTLAAVLHELEDSSTVLRQQLLQTVRDNLDTFIASYSRHHQLHDQLVDLASQCASSMQSSTDDTAAAVRDALQHHQDALMSATTNENEMAALKTIQKIVDMADACEQNLNKDVEASTQHLLQLEAALRDLALRKNVDGVDWSALRVFDLVRLRSIRLREQLIGALEGYVAQAIQFSHEGHTSLVVTRSPAPYFGCFESLEILSEQMAAIKRSLYKHLIIPFFERPSHLVVEGNILNLGAGGTSHPMDGCQMIDEMDTMLRFFSTHFFNNQDDKKTRRRLFGNLIMPELTKLLVDKALAPAVPASASDLPSFDRVIDRTHRFEQTCVEEYGFVPSEEVPGVLANYVENIDKHFATKRSEKALHEGRNIMLRRLYDVEDIENGPAHYQITQTPKLLSFLLGDVMAEASSLQSSHPISAKKLVEAVFNLLDLYRAVMPCYHRSHFLSQPAAALIFRNDCFWLAGALKNDLAQRHEGIALAERLVGAAGRLETLGKTWYEVVLAQRTQVLHALLDKTGGFDRISENRLRAQESEETIERVIDQIQAIAPAIQDCVEEALFMKLMGGLVDTVLARLIGDIEHIHDIGADDSHLIAHCLNGLLKLVDVFDRPNQSATEPFVMTLVPSWRKFWILKDLLDMNLQDIIARFRRDELFMFEKSELVGLIKALFADTDRRESIINEIQTSQPGQHHLYSDAAGLGEDGGHNDWSKEEGLVIDKPQSSLSMAPQDDDDDMEGWDNHDEPITHLLPSLSTKSHEPIARTTSSHSMEPKDDVDEEEVMGWDDDEYEPIIPSVVPVTTATPARTSITPKEEEEEDMSGWDEHDEPIIPSLDTDKKQGDLTITRSSSRSLSMTPKDDDDEEEEMGGWDDPTDDPIIPQNPPISSKTPATDTTSGTTKSSLLMAPEDMDEEDWSGWDN